MAELPPAENVVPTQDERTMAILAHALQMVGMFFDPLVIFIVKRQSRFVSFHALQALIFQLIYISTSFVVIGLFMATMIFTVANQPSGSQAAHGGPPLAVLIFFPLIWLVMMGLWIVSLLLAIFYSIKAGKGEWAEYPLLGRVARKILKLDPDGSPLIRP